MEENSNQAVPLQGDLGDLRAVSVISQISLRDDPDAV